MVALVSPVSFIVWHRPPQGDTRVPENPEGNIWYPKVTLVSTKGF